MTNADIMDAIGELPEEMIAPVAALRQRKPIHWGRWVALAACICLMLLPLSWQGWQAGNKAAAKVDKATNAAMSQESAQENESAQYGSIMDGTGQAIFRAEVLEVDDTRILVKPLEGEDELRSSDKIYASFLNLKEVPKIAVGDIVEITYSGMIQETYPAGAADVTDIRVIE